MVEYRYAMDKLEVTSTEVSPEKMKVRKEVKKRPEKFDDEVYWVNDASL